MFVWDIVLMMDFVVDVIFERCFRKLRVMCLLVRSEGVVFLMLVIFDLGDKVLLFFLRGVNWRDWLIVLNVRWVILILVKYFGCFEWMIICVLELRGMVVWVVWLFVFVKFFFKVLLILSLIKWVFGRLRDNFFIFKLIYCCV